MHLLVIIIVCEIWNMQLRGWYSKDDVVAEWKRIEGQLALHIHCYVSGPNLMLDLAAEFRYHIFSKEMPLVSVFFPMHLQLYAFKND